MDTPAAAVATATSTTEGTCDVEPSAEPQQADEADADGNEPRAAMVWSPELVESLSQEELDLYVQFAATPCIPGGGCNIEEALEVLHEARGNIPLAMQRLLRQPPTKQSLWSMNEVQNFERLKMLHGKDFYLISRLLRTKTRQEVVQFYYKWKKSALRHRAGSPQMSTHSLASVSSVTSTSTLSTTSSTSSATISSTSPQTTVPLMNQQTASNLSQLTSVLAVTPSTSSPLSTSDESRDSGRGDELLAGIFGHSSHPYHFQRQQQQHQHQQQQASSISPSETFPCKVCGRVFEKVKSRSAHMKRHKNERLYNSK